MRIRTAMVAAVMAAAAVFVGAGAAAADSGAEGAAIGSPGVLSGDNVQIPVHLPINLCGNSIDIIALLNPAFGGACAND